MAQTTLGADRIGKPGRGQPGTGPGARATLGAALNQDFALVIVDRVIATAAFSLAFYWREGFPCSLDQAVAGF